MNLDRKVPNKRWRHTEAREPMVMGFLLEMCLNHDGQLPTCSACNQGWWVPVGFFTTRTKYEDWMVECGYEQLPEKYLLSEVPIDEGPLGVTTELFSSDNGVSYTTNSKDTNWLPRGEEE